MPRFCANISMLFTEVAMPERFGAAARSGFKAVEIQFPYEWDKNELAGRAAEAGVEIALFNLPAGKMAKGVRGIGCLPSRMSEFRDGVGAAIDYARALGCKRLNCLAGIAPRAMDNTLRETFISNLRFAAGELEREGILLVMEPINTRSVPGFYLRNTGQGAALIAEAAVANLKLQYDWYHMQIMEGDLAKTMEANLAAIGHMQFADVPDRHQPGSGEINFPFLFSWMDKIGYEGWIGAEYVPSGRTEDTLDWLRPYLVAEQPAGE